MDDPYWVFLAEKVATAAHLNQKRKNGLPYIIHPAAVAGMVDGARYKAVAWLHDVLEDTSVTETELRKQFPDDIVDAVLSVTRQNGESYLDFVLRAKKDPIGRVVKRADIMHNLSDLTPGSLLDKYKMAIYILDLP